MKLPKIITHANADPIFNKICKLPCMQPGPELQRPPWIDTPVTLEFPTGELCRDALRTLALIGSGRDYELAELDGSERFNAQGLEGKVRVRKSLLAALLNLDLLPEYRARIVTR